MRTLLLALGIALLLTGCASPEVRDARRSYNEVSRGAAPRPKIWTDNLGGEHWTTHGGEDAGGVTYETRVIRQGLHDFDLNMVFQGFKTMNGFWVARDGSRSLIFIPDKSGNFTRQEIYGPNLKSIRATREAEKSLIEQGGDILYITGEGIFKASELGDKPTPALATAAIDEIAVLSVIDARFKKYRDFKWDKMLPNPTVNKMEGKGYAARMVLDPSLVTAMTQEAVDRANPDWIRNLGPADAQWVFVWSVTDVPRASAGASFTATSSGFWGISGQPGLAATLFDKRNGTIAWRGQFEITRPLPGLAANDAVEEAFQTITSAFPRKDSN